MKNKKLGKILLCTTLALATPFALTACSKKAAENNTPDNNEPEIQQPVVSDVKIAYAKDFEGANTDNTTVKNYTEISAVKEDLSLIIVGYADSTKEKFIAASEGNQAYWNGAMAGVNQMLGDGTAVHFNESHKYVITLGAGDDTKAAYDAYVELYANDTNWNDMSEIPGYEGSKGVYWTTGEARDVMIDATYNTTEGKIYITVLSFDAGAMAEAMGE